MGKKKKKRTSKLPEEIRRRLDRAAEAVIGGLPADDPMALFTAHTADLEGHESDLVDVLAGVRRSEVLNFLHQLAGGKIDKALVKAARKAIYRLEMAGLEAGDGYKGKGVPIIKAPEARRPVGYLGQFDPMGTRVGVLTMPGVPSGWDAGLFMVNLNDGLVDFNAFSVSSGELKRLINVMGEEVPSGLIPVPAGAARRVLADGADRARARGLPLNDDYKAFTPLMGSVSLPEHPAIYDHIAPEDADGIDLDLETGRLLDHDFLIGFTVAGELEPYMHKLDEVETSVLVLSEAQKKERKEAVVDQAAEELFTPERLALLKMQFEDTALLFWESGDRDLARAAVAAARVLDGDDVPEKARPIIREIVTRSFDTVFEILGRAADNREETGLVESPDSGLIVPGFTRD